MPLTKWFLSGSLKYGREQQNPEFVVIGFQQCRYIEWESYYQNLHSRLLDAILNQAVPRETMLDVNKMLMELEEATLNVVNEVHEYGITEYDEGYAQ